MIEKHLKLYILHRFGQYADVVLDNFTKTESGLLESVQLEAMRIITGLRRGTSHHILYTETQLEPLCTRRQNHKLLLMLQDY